MNKNARLGMLAACLLAGAVSGADNAESVPHYTTADWQVAGLGNVRARVDVAGKTAVIWAHVPWRRHDRQPENKDVIVICAATGKRVANVIPAKISRETGDVLFEPAGGSGEYYIYYMPFQTGGAYYFPSTVYLTPTNTADPAWTAACAPAIARIKQGEPPEIPQVRLIDIQTVNDFHRFDPMEITATAEEIGVFMDKYGAEPYLLFPEDRRNPIRMENELPLRWVQAGPGRPFNGEADRGEFYCFQVGLYACSQPIEDVSISFKDLIGSRGGVIPASALRCFNLAGTNWLGKQFHKTVNLPKGRVQALWVGIAVPKDLSAQTFRGKLRLAAKNAPPASVAIELKVSEALLADGGDSEIWRQSRLRWLDSTIGLDDEVFAPYTPVNLQEHTIAILGRTATLNDTGLLDGVASTFSRNIDKTNAPPCQILAGPMRLVAESPAGQIRWTTVNSKIVNKRSGSIAWEAESEGGPLKLECAAKMECDGYINFNLTVRAADACDLNDVRLEIPLRREIAVYMMGMGREGGYRPASWDWKWNPAYANNQLWIGDVNAGLSVKLKDTVDHWDLYNLKESGTYRDWSKDNLGGCTVREEGDRVVIRVYTGPRQLGPDKPLRLNFGLLITPVKTLDQAHWNWRYFPEGSSKSLSEVAAMGARIVNVHQGDPLNPYINYPFRTGDKLSAYTREAHSRGMKVKLYYTVRELSDYTGEFWPLRSLGSEVFRDGPGFELTDQFAQKRAAQEVTNTGDSWLCEHVVSDYIPAWHTPLANGRVDAALATVGLSRWHNYYLEGLSWLVREVGIDGLYLDGVGYDREIMKRVRKVLLREGHDCLIDFHSGNNFHPEYGLNNVANQYIELFPYIDSIWLGEGFDYDKPPDYWMVEVAGIPYGLFGEMLQGGGNPWRGMLFGMTGRLGYGSNPGAIWELWDHFGIKDATMVGYWDPHCPVKTGLKDILATAYVKKGHALVSVASWAANPAKLRLQIDWERLGMDAGKTSLHAPAIPSFQPKKTFRLDEDIPVDPGKGWLLLLETDKK